jgi:hypothetical protein
MAAAMAAQSGKSGSAALTETGYVVNLKDGSFSISNVAVGGGGPAGGGGPMVFSRQGKAPSKGEGKVEGQVVMRGPDGKVESKRLEDMTPEERERVRKAQESGQGNVTVRQVRPEDLTPEQRERLAKSGGKAVTFGGDGSVAPRSQQRSAEDHRLRHQRAHRRIGEIANGAKVKVTYTEQDGKKVATRIEVVK